MNNQTMLDILLTPHTVKPCKQDPKKYEAYLCDCESCRDYERYEEQRDVWLMDRYTESQEEEE